MTVFPFIEVGEHTFKGFTVRAQHSRKFGPINFGADLELGGGVIEETWGTFARASTFVRHRLGHFSFGDEIGFLGSVDAGLGWHRTPGDAGRPDVAVGCSWELRVRDVGYLFGFRMLLAEEPAVPEAEVPVGSSRARARGLDSGVFFSFGARWF